MNYTNFTDYLFSKMEQNKANVTIYASTEKSGIEYVSPNEAFNLDVRRKGNTMAWSLDGYQFDEKHRRAMCAFINTYNDKVDVKNKLHIKGNKIMVFDIVESVDDLKSIEIIEDVINFFTGKNEVTEAINTLLASAKARQAVIRSRVDELKTRACNYENQNEHDKATICYHEVCQYYTYSHMELIALLYSNGKDHPFAQLCITGKDTPWGKFPINAEYQLEYQMMAVERCQNDNFNPIVAYNLANKLGKTKLCEKLLAIGQERGTWNAIALSSMVKTPEMFKRIANCYRKGIGCERNESYANYYDRLLAGERQEVFKDMLNSGFEPVFELMNANSYYNISSLDDLNGLSDEFKGKFLYGDAINEFELPEWFVPMVNSLPETEREFVLKEVYGKLQSSIEIFTKKLEAKEFEVVNKEGYGCLVEATGKLKCYFVPNLDNLKASPVANQLKSLLIDFMASIEA